jgi:putative RNA 2'-phosphotransferase
MTDSASLTRLSKFLAVMLRHEPRKFGLSPDAEGYVSLQAMLEQIEKRYPGRFSRADLDAVVAGDASGKKRYEIAGDQIRALYGHSQVQVEYPPAVPPTRLYHGTVTQYLDSIRERGLQAQARQYVHLTTSLERARTVAGRHDDSIVVLSIRADAAHADGIIFYHPEAEHYLARFIPREYIEESNE